MVAAGVTALVSLSSPQGVWITLNQFQCLALLLLTGAYLPDDVVYFLSGMDFTSLSFSFVPVSSALYLRSMADWVDSDLDDEYLAAAGLESRSSLVNCASLFAWSMFVVAMHVLVFAVLFQCRCRISSKYKCLARLRLYVFRLFTLAVYIRLVLGANQFVLISSSLELNSFQHQSAGKTVSLAVAVFLYAG